MKYEIDFQGLEAFLKSLTDEEIQSGALQSAVPQKQIEYLEAYGKDTSNILVRIKYGEPFICDVFGNDLSVFVHHRREYKLPDRSHSICAKFVRTVVTDCHKQYGTAVNGVWKIPPQFITPKF